LLIKKLIKKFVSFFNKSQNLAVHGTSGKHCSESQKIGQIMAFIQTFLFNFIKKAVILTIFILDFISIRKSLF